MTSMHLTDEQVRNAIIGLLLDRAPPATICPSEAARALAPGAWRPLMPRVRAVAIALAKSGVLEIRQGGRTIAPEEPLRGPIRLGRPDASSIPADDAPLSSQFQRPNNVKKACAMAALAACNRLR